MPARHMSLWVDGFPSSQGVLSGFAGFEHVPLVRSQSPASWPVLGHARHGRTSGTSTCLACVASGASVVVAASRAVGSLRVATLSRCLVTFPGDVAVVLRQTGDRGLAGAHPGDAHIPGGARIAVFTRRTVPLCRVRAPARCLVARPGHVALVLRLANHAETLVDQAIIRSKRRRPSCCRRRTPRWAPQCRCRMLGIG